MEDLEQEKSGKHVKSSELPENLSMPWLSIIRKEKKTGANALSHPLFFYFIAEFERLTFKIKMFFIRMLFDNASYSSLN